MQVHLAIGQNHHFKLHEALLVYSDQQSSFIKTGPPRLCRWILIDLSGCGGSWI
jgi:hypothetical protein